MSINIKKILSINFLLITTIVLLFVNPTQVQDATAKGQNRAGKDVMVATAHPLASQAAIEMLQKGGNAVDAAVAAAFAVGVVEPDGSGLGGGGGMVIYLNKEKKSFYINYYQRGSEKVLNINFDSKSDSKTAKAITVPGTVAGLTLALEKFGTLPLAVVLEPAISYAEDGFPVDETLSKIILDNLSHLQKYSTTENIYLREGFPLVEGDTLYQSDLANTLRLIAANGRAGFYGGPVAQQIVDEVTKNGGVMTLNDLKNYKAQIVEPVRSTYRGYEVLSANAPQSGAFVIEALNILENENLARFGHYSTSVECLHLMAETFRRVYADRSAFLDDPNFAYVPSKGIISKSFTRARFDDIDMNTAYPTKYRDTKEGNPSLFEKAGAERQIINDNNREQKIYQWGDEDDEGKPSSEEESDDLFNAWGGKKKTLKKENKPKIQIEDTTKTDVEVIEYEGGHTTHLSILDKDGNAVSLTQTLGNFFGSGLTTAGVLMNNSMTNFAATTTVNAPKPNKQPRSSIAPTILLKDGKPFMVVGSPGAARIITTIVELIVNVVDFGMTAEEANHAPRFFVQKNEDFLSLESRITQGVQDGLVKRGHRLKLYEDYDLFFGGAQLILIDPVTKEVTGSADPRRGGTAMGD